MASFLYKKNNKFLTIVDFDGVLYNEIVNFIDKNEDSLINKKLFFNQEDGIYSDSEFQGKEVKILADDFDRIADKVFLKKDKVFIDKISNISFKLNQLYNFDNEANLIFIAD